MTDAHETIAAWLRDAGYATPDPITTNVPVAEGLKAPGEIFSATGFFQKWAEEEAVLEPGEYPFQIWLAGVLLKYAGQVDNGGHDQWITNLRFNELHIEAVGFGLDLLGLKPFHDIWQRYKSYASSSKTRSELRKRWGFGPRDAASSELDKAFFALTSAPIRQAVSDWLLSQSCIQEFPAEQLKRERDLIIARSTEREARLAEQARQYVEGDPLAFAVKALCAQIGATPVSVLTRDQQPSVIRKAGRKLECLLWTVHTDRGQLLLEVHPPATPFSTPVARLTELDMSKPRKRSVKYVIPKIQLARMPITKAQYERVLQYFAIA